MKLMREGLKNRRVEFLITANEKMVAEPKRKQPNKIFQ